MWESNNLDSAAGEEPGVPELDRGPAASPQEAPAVPHAEMVGTAHPLPHWSGPVLQGVSTPRVFSALASAASRPPSNGTNGFGAIDHGEPAGAGAADGLDGDEYFDADADEDDQVWSPEATAARMRAQQRWREMNPSAVLPPITLTEEEAAALLPPGEHQVAMTPHPAYPAETAAAQDGAPPRSAPVAPWLPARVATVGAPIGAYGPVGRRRSPATVVLLSVLTLGGYALWWHHRVNREMAEFDPHMSVDAGNSTWAVALPLMIGWVVAGMAAARWLLAVSGTPTTDLPFSADQSLLLAFSPFAVPYLELLLPFSAIAVVMTNERARSIQDRIDIPADRQVRPLSALGWLTVPVVGGLVGMARLQRTLNEVWSSVAS